MAKPVIVHPQESKSTHSPTFAACGYSDLDATITGVMINETTGKKSPHSHFNSRKAKSKKHPNTSFWILGFKVNGDANDKYTLEISDGTNTVRAVHISIAADHKKKFGTGLTITYPQAPGDNPLPQEFVAYGTADTSDDLNATNCKIYLTAPDYDRGASFSQDSPPPDWILYCFASQTDNPGDLYVEQQVTGAPADSKGLDIEA